MEYIASERCAFGKGDFIEGGYTVEKALGEGTFGCVYRVRGTDGTQYALKLLKLWEVLSSERPSLVRRFDMEFETGKIQSNYLVHSYVKGNVKGNPYIVMEFCSGGDLQSCVNSSKIDLPTAAAEILYGLSDLHKCGKVHRDLKPENVLIRADGTAVLTDFGISGDRNHRMTQRGINGVPKQLFGTFGYMPPEQVNPRRGNATVLPTTDIFSFGVMMYQLITGDLPFGRLQVDTDLPMYIDNGKKGVWDRERLRKCRGGQQWERVIEGCLVPDFKSRLQSADEVLPLLPEGKKTIFREQPEMPQPQMQIVNGLLLRVMQGEESGKIYRLNELTGGYRNILTMGRYSDDIYNVIPIREYDSAYVSRCHCTLEFNPQEGWIIRDGQWRSDCPTALRSEYAYPCGSCSVGCREKRFDWKRSMNGTFVNSTEVDNTGMYIQPGDIITIGDTKLRVEGY